MLDYNPLQIVHFLLRARDTISFPFRPLRWLCTKRRRHTSRPVQSVSQPRLFISDQNIRLKERGYTTRSTMTVKPPGFQPDIGRDCLTHHKLPCPKLLWLSRQQLSQVPSKQILSVLLLLLRRAISTENEQYFLISRVKVAHSHSAASCPALSAMRLRW